MVGMSPRAAATHSGGIWARGTHTQAHAHTGGASISRNPTACMRAHTKTHLGTRQQSIDVKRCTLRFAYLPQYGHVSGGRQEGRLRRHRGVATVRQQDTHGSQVTTKARKCHRTVSVTIQEVPRRARGEEDLNQVRSARPNPGQPTFKRYRGRAGHNSPPTGTRPRQLQCKKKANFKIKRRTGASTPAYARRDGTRTFPCWPRCAAGCPAPRSALRLGTQAPTAFPPWRRHPPSPRSAGR